MNKSNVINICLVLISERAESEEMGLDFSYPEVGDLTPVAVLCGLSIFFTTLWLLVVFAYIRLMSKK